MESLKINKEIKGLSKYVREHILPIFEKKTDQTMKKVLEILALKYGCTRTEKIEDFMDDWTKFRDNQYEDDGELLLGMKELNQRRKELKMTEDKWVAVWMLGFVKKRKGLDKFFYQALRDVVKPGGDNVILNIAENSRNSESNDTKRKMVYLLQLCLWKMMKR